MRSESHYLTDFISWKESFVFHSLTHPQCSTASHREPQSYSRYFKHWQPAPGVSAGSQESTEAGSPQRNAHGHSCTPTHSPGVCPTLCLHLWLFTGSSSKEKDSASLNVFLREEIQEIRLRTQGLPQSIRCVLFVYLIISFAQQREMQEKTHTKGLSWDVYKKPLQHHWSREASL